MTDPSDRLALFDDLLRRLSAAVRGIQLYSPDHPLVARNIEGLVATLRQVHARHPSFAIGLVGSEVVVADTPLPKGAAALGDLVGRLETADVERITIEQGVTPEEVSTFIRAIAALPARRDAAAEPGTATGIPPLPHIRVGQIATPAEGEGIAADLAVIRKLYTDAVKGAEGVWDTANAEGTPDLNAARSVVDDLAETATQNRSALVALTAMKNYDNYTFTHMVNVSILTIGQARALGIEGQLLREFGLSALMHDIGKVRTPTEILNKPEKLTDHEFVVMKRHVVDGAEILRQTPEMPTLGPVVALEHHRRVDGTGYPHITRSSLNLATMLCSIADVYDAMRSQRAYQQAFPTDRILAIYNQKDGSLFDHHLIRRFVQLIGIYPPGNLVRLSNDEIAVVQRVHAPDPFRPKVRVMIDASGQQLARPREVNLWQSAGGENDVSIVAPLDPSDYSIDPMSLIEAV